MFSSDRTVRVVNIESGEEVSRLALVDDEVGGEHCGTLLPADHYPRDSRHIIAGDRRVFCSARDAVRVYSLAHPHRLATRILSPVTHLWLASPTPSAAAIANASINNPSPCPARLVAVAHDGAVRLISPVSGNILTSALPAITYRVTVVAVAYDRQRCPKRTSAHANGACVNVYAVY